MRKNAMQTVSWNAPNCNKIHVCLFLFLDDKKKRNKLAQAERWNGHGFETLTQRKEEKINNIDKHSMDPSACFQAIKNSIGKLNVENFVDQKEFGKVCDGIK